MISIRNSKLIKSLLLKKYRQLENKFVVEGAKNVVELINSDLKIHSIYVTDDFMSKNKGEFHSFSEELISVSEADLKKVGSFNANNAALAVVEIPALKSVDYTAQSILAFDRIKNPGNLGTVIRIADWYGFSDIICSPDSVDCYNVKVISASMGSFSRVQVHYLDLKEVLSECNMAYGTTLEGNDIHNITFVEPSVILFGNESTGISDELKKYLNQEVLIPGYGAAESLNVAISAAVFCDNFKRGLKKT